VVTISYVILNTVRGAAAEIDATSSKACSCYRC